jgi:hypothetical protein
MMEEHFNLPLDPPSLFPFLITLLKLAFAYARPITWAQYCTTMYLQVKCYKCAFLAVHSAFLFSFIPGTSINYIYIYIYIYVYIL